ncbi:response regulator transcription factor, partial [Streptomyces collinus]|uniref:response regulator transcription factor n=1 Tax=Streptomyces collinus TaxID=42684 RepID=UPI003693B016
TPQVIRSTEGTQSYRARRPAALLQDREKHNGGAAPPAWVGRLTGRESEVLRHMAGGLTNAEMARSMEVGAATVRSHGAAVLAETGTRDRTQAVIAAYEAGLLNVG